MTARERRAHDSGAVTAPPRPLPNGHGRSLALPEESHAAFWSWEAWFKDASDGQRQSLLDLARRQGLVYAHQVPAPPNGLPRKAEPQPQMEQVRRWLAGDIDPLSPLSSEELAIVDQELDLAQREAVRRAVLTPDMCLVQGLPGAGKSRVVAEMVHQCALRGERVLFGAFHGSALDVVLMRLAGRSSVFAIRHLDAKEPAENLPAQVRAWTLAERRQGFHSEALLQAAAAQHEAENRCRRRGQEEGLWPPLRDLAAQWEDTQASLGSLNEQRFSWERDVHWPSDHPSQEDSPLRLRLVPLDEERARVMAALETDQLRLQQEVASQAARLADLTRQKEDLEPYSAARQHRRWWTWTWWKALFRGDVVGQVQALSQEIQKLTEASQAAHHALEQLPQQQQDNGARFEQERRRIIEEAIAGLRQGLEDQEHRLRQEQATLRQEWKTLIEPLDAGDCPTEPTRAAVEQAYATWCQHCGQDADTLELMRRWRQFIEEAGPPLASHVLDHANVQAATVAALAQNPRLAIPLDSQFDVLILDGAERLTEADLAPVAARAKRWVLIGEGPLAGADEALLDPPGRSASRGPSSQSLSCFQQLWRRLHGPEPAPNCAWLMETDRLSCNFHPVAAEDARYIESERLADAPDIELRILARPKTRPVLAQVVFPASINVQQAKSYIYREMQELAVAPAGRGGWWREQDGRWFFQFSPRPQAHAWEVDLESGLREWVTPQGATCCLEFIHWPRDRAKAWVETHLGRRDQGRTAWLEIPYRLGDLADPIFAILFPDHHAARARPGSQALEFVRVPPPRQENGRKSDKTPRPAATSCNGLWPKEGAGLELDLSGPRLADRLPADLRAELPRQGLVNFLEAQAVIRRLEELARSQTGRQSPAILVMALFEAQVALIRLLAARSETLRAVPGLFALGLPAAFIHQEADLALVSLTRSHVHRAVPFAVDPRDFVLALTRARQRLILVGDPGTLVKRSQWQGPLEHQSAAAAQIEAQRLTRLIKVVGG